MSKPVRLYCWHFMSYPYLPADFDGSYDSGWITVLPEVVVQDELRSGVLVNVGQSSQLSEHFYAITAQRDRPVGPLNELLVRATANVFDG